MNVIGLKLLLRIHNLSVYCIIDKAHWNTKHRKGVLYYGNTILA